jgi:hypothetical protein
MQGVGAAVQVPKITTVATVWLSCTYLLVRRKPTNTIIAGSEQGFGFIIKMMKFKFNIECLNK